MVEHVVEALAGELRDVVIIGRDQTLAGRESFPDMFPGHRGPLAGLATALLRFQRPVLLVAVDQPLLRPDTVRHLLATGGPDDTVIPVDEVPQVTCARYPASLATTARTAIEAGMSLKQILDTGPVIRVGEDEWAAWGEDGRSWYSMDSPAAIVEAERRFRIGLLD